MSSDNAKRWELIKQAEKTAAFHKMALGMNPTTMRDMGIGAAVGGLGGAAANVFANPKDKDEEGEEIEGSERSFLGDVSKGIVGGGLLGGAVNQAYGGPAAPPKKNLQVNEGGQRGAGGADAAAKPSASPSLDMDGDGIPDGPMRPGQGSASLATRPLEPPAKPPAHDADGNGVPDSIQRPPETASPTETGEDVGYGPGYDPAVLGEGVTGELSATPPPIDTGVPTPPPTETAAPGHGGPVMGPGANGQQVMVSRPDGTYGSPLDAAGREVHVQLPPGYTIVGGGGQVVGPDGWPVTPEQAEGLLIPITGPELNPGDYGAAEEQYFGDQLNEDGSVGPPLPAGPASAPDAPTDTPATVPSGANDPANQQPDDLGRSPYDPDYDPITYPPSPPSIEPGLAEEEAAAAAAAEASGIAAQKKKTEDSLAERKAKAKKPAAKSTSSRVDPRGKDMSREEILGPDGKMGTSDDYTKKEEKEKKGSWNNWTRESRAPESGVEVGYRMAKQAFTGSGMPNVGDVVDAKLTVPIDRDAALQQLGKANRTALAAHAGQIAMPVIGGGIGALINALRGKSIGRGAGVGALTGTGVNLGGSAGALAAGLPAGFAGPTEGWIGQSVGGLAGAGAGGYGGYQLGQSLFGPEEEEDPDVRETNPAKTAGSYTKKKRKRKRRKVLIGPGGKATHRKTQDEEEEKLAALLLQRSIQRGTSRFLGR